MAQQCVFDPACLPFLYALLDDKERGIRSNAISAIVYLADKNIERGISLRVFIAHFDSEDFEKKTVGLEGLAELVLSGITDPYYLEEAVDLLDNNSVEVRNRAAKLIGALAIRNVTDPRCWHSLVAMMDNEETARISTWAFNCLMGSETAQPQLIELMCESDLEIRILALRGLKKMVEKGVYNPVCLDLAIISLNEAHSKDMDNSAAWLIGELAKRDVKDRRCLPRLIQMMDERDTIESSSWALWQLAEKEVYAPSCLMKVISLLDDGKVRIRNNAAFLIGGLARNYVRNRKSLPLLIALMEYSETSLASTYALCCLAEKDVCDDTSLLKAIKLLDDSEAQVRGYAAALVGLLAKNGIWDSICLPTLIKLFDDSDEDTKADAIEAAARFYSIANEEQREVIKLKMTELKTIESEDIRKAIDMALEEIAKIESPKA
jgi:HEAT repeat protein